MREPVIIGNATLYMADCLEVLPLLSNVDAVITDPPYSSGGAVRGDRMQETSVKYLTNDSLQASLLPEFSGDTRDQRGFHFWSALWAGAALRACNQSAIACFFTDWRQLPISTDYMQSGGLVWRGIVPWAKPGYRPQMGRFGAQCEYVTWGSAGALPVDRGVGCLPGFFNHSVPSAREHITQKPVDLMMEIIGITPPGALILDPFMGSGTTGVACAQTGRPFIGIEITQANFDVACERISRAQAQGQMFAEPVKAEQVRLIA